MYAIKYKHDGDNKNKCLSINNWKPTLTDVGKTKIYPNGNLAKAALDQHKDRLPEETDVYDYTIEKVVVMFEADVPKEEEETEE